MSNKNDKILKIYMKTIITSLLLFIIVNNANSQEVSNVKLYTYNIALYTTTAIVRSAVKKESLKENLIRGFVAGNISYVGKSIKQPLLSRTVHSFAPMIINKKHMIDIFNFTLVNGRPKLNVTSTYSIFNFLKMGGKFDMKTSLKHASLVFSIEKFEGYRGREIGNSFVYKIREGQESTIRHEFIHTLQFTEFMMYNDVIYHPFRNNNYFLKMTKYIQLDNPVKSMCTHFCKGVCEMEAKNF